jgi:DNA-binding CsgD family transcriptional regulator
VVRSATRALGIEAARGALLREDTAAEELHREALERLGHTRIRVELARAQLRYGEWLRRQGRRVDARAQLRTAHEALTGLTNNEIAAQLYLSPRTVEWHLRKVFTKAGVSTRRQLRRSLHDVRTS